jgi:hypothetical protein
MHCYPDLGFFRPSRQILWQEHKLGHGYFIPCPFPFIIHLSLKCTESCWKLKNLWSWMVLNKDVKKYWLRKCNDAWTIIVWSVKEDVSVFSNAIQNKNYEQFLQSRNYQGTVIRNFQINQCFGETYLIILPWRCEHQIPPKCQYLYNYTEPLSPKIKIFPEVKRGFAGHKHGLKNKEWNYL